MNHARILVTTLLLANAALSGAQAAPTCRADASAASPTVVELYTSEGCSSCPPADKWLSTLKGRPDVLALAFHVNYWDRLGWVDRYASVEGTDRQRDLANQSGSSQVYTPQVIVNGRDWRIWPKLPAAAAPSPVEISLARDGDTVTARITASKSGMPRLAGYWAVLEDNHQTQVRAGENSGETLKHDHVVRLYRPVAAWAAGAGTQLELKVSRGDPAFPRRVVFVVTDAGSAKPLQAATLSC